MTFFGIRPVFWPTLFTIPALIALLALGTWQVQRLQWKQGVIDRIEARTVAPPAPLPAGNDLDPAAWEYRRVSVTGSFLHDRELHLLSHSERGNLGYHVISPLQRADGGFVLVNRGWVPDERKDPATRAEGQVEGEVTITGIVRKPWHQGWFVPDNDPARNLWFYGDVAAMQRQAGIEAPPLMVEADAAPNPGGLPIGGQTRLQIPNNHLQYAITWYSFAVALLVIYFVWHRQRGPKDGGT